MRQRYIRVPAERRDTVAALMVSGVVAAGVGAVTFYLTRVLLAREPLDAGPPRLSEEGTDAPSGDRPLLAGDVAQSRGGA